MIDFDNSVAPEFKLIDSKRLLVDGLANTFSRIIRTRGGEVKEIIEEKLYTIVLSLDVVEVGQEKLTELSKIIHDNLKEIKSLAHVKVVIQDNKIRTPVGVVEKIEKA